MLWLVKRWQSLNPVSLLLWPLSFIYCVLAVLRRALYRAGVLTSLSLPVPVIVVGNITVGGTGKTPLVIWLAGWLKQRGRCPGIVLRGYGGAARHWPRQVLPVTSAAEVGDEAVLLARRSGCPVVAGPDRVAAAKMLVGELGCDVIVSDDGLQHYRLKRDFEIAVVDGARRYGNHLCLPAGPLREPRWRTNSVDMIVVNGRPRTGELSMQLRPTVIRNLKTGDAVEPAQLASKKVRAVAGIGNPHRFFETLRGLGLVVEEKTFPDHYRFRPEDIFTGAGQEVVMTEKDAVKCELFATEHHWVLLVDAQPDPAIEQQLAQWLGDKRSG